MRHLLSLSDLTDEEVRSILLRSAELEDGTAVDHHRFVVGLLFLTSSLRTRIGFATAAHRLGGAVVEAGDLRFGPAMSVAESLEDTLRCLSGMVDVVACRTATALAGSVGQADPAPVAPVVNAGDRDGHPTQALIDLRAVEAERGDIADLTVALCGDLGQRSARSFLELLARFPPGRLVLMSPTDVVLPAALQRRAERRPPTELDDVDVLSMVGFPAGSDRSADAVRLAHVLDAERVGRLPADAVVLSPLPVIDEVHPSARGDRRVAMWAQSDRGVHVRAAVLEWALQVNR